MKIGTKSLLFGVHQFLIHPFFVAFGWLLLYGFPWDPRIWILFVVHDLGYWGMPNMDGAEGETHPEFGARIMRKFDRDIYEGRMVYKDDPEYRLQALKDGFTLYLSGASTLIYRKRVIGKWEGLALYHSRHYAKLAGVKPSRLCFADKLAFVLTPRWLYMPCARMSGELREYILRAQQSKDEHWNYEGFDADQWHSDLCRYMFDWIFTHRDGSEDTWTTAGRNSK